MMTEIHLSGLIFLGIRPDGNSAAGHQEDGLPVANEVSVKGRVKAEEVPYLKSFVFMPSAASILSEIAIIVSSGLEIWY